VSIQGDRIRQFYELSGKAADGWLRTMCHADVRMAVPDRLPYGGSVQGVHDVVDRIAQLRAFQTLKAGDAGMLDDTSIVVHFSDVHWIPAAFKARSLQSPPTMLGSTWWFFRDDKVEEILFLYYDVGLIPAPQATARGDIAYPSWPRNSLLRYGSVRRGNNGDNPHQRLVEKVYADAISGVVTDITASFHDDLTLHESNGLPYGGGDHHGMQEVSQVIAEVVVWCDMSNVRLVAVASQGEHVSVLVASPFRGKDQRILIQEDWHLRAGKVAWYRAYYWDTEAVGFHYRQMKNNA
jgi:hypothetical protein